MALTILHKNRRLATSVWIASSFLDRLIGLIGTAELSRERALVIPRCSMVHMFFMRYPIDVVFLSRERVVLSIVSELRPWRVSPAVKGAYYAVELASGVAQERGVNIGDELVWESVKK